MHPLARSALSPWLAIIVATTFALGCQSPVRTTDWSKYDGPGARHFQREEVTFPHVPDPIEPINRGVSIFNHGLMTLVIRPVSFVYRLTTPPFLRDGVSNALANLRYPERFVGNVLQGKWAGAASETGRFLVNSSVGLGGLFEVAEPTLSLTPSDEDFGQALGRWGWTRSTFFQLPVYGPVTVRDAFGLIGDSAANPLTYVPWASTIQTAAEVTDTYPAYRRFVEANFDPYELGKLLYVLERELRIIDSPPPSPPVSSGSTETLGIVFLAPEDPRFADTSRTHRVRVPGAQDPLPYSCWIRDEPSPLVFIIPGTGSHRLSDSAVAIAELAHGRGLSVASISSTINHEFLDGAATNLVPGYLPTDTADVLTALERVSADLDHRYPGMFEEKILLGLSLGGMQSLYLAATEDDRPASPLVFDLFAAINAPIDLAFAIETLDRFYNAPLAFEPGLQRFRIRQILRKALDLVQGTGDTRVPQGFTPEEAEFLIGLAFRTMVRDVIYQAQAKHDFGVLKTPGGSWTRTAPYREILQFSFMEYFYAFVLPYYAERDPSVDFDERGAETLLARCDLRRWASGLCDNPKVLYFGNENDSLLAPAHVTWLKEDWDPRRVVLFERGGHMGNLYLEDVRFVIARVLERAIDGRTER